jgi:hypothetical protein
MGAAGPGGEPCAIGDTGCGGGAAARLARRANGCGVFPWILQRPLDFCILQPPAGARGFHVRPLGFRCWRQSGRPSASLRRVRLPQPQVQSARAHMADSIAATRGGKRARGRADLPARGCGA